jgi:hypothetical protein
MKLNKNERELLQAMVDIAVKQQFIISFGDARAYVYSDSFPFKTGKAKTLQSLIDKGLVDRRYDANYQITESGFRNTGNSSDCIIRRLIRAEIKRWFDVSEFDKNNDSYNIWNVHRPYSQWQQESMLELYQGWQEKHPESYAPLHDGQELCMWHYNESIMNNLLIRETNVQALEHLLAKYETRIATLAYALRTSQPLSPDAHTFR